MRIFNYEFKIIKATIDIKSAILDKAEANATAGTVQARLELRHHEFLLEQLENKLPPSAEEKETLEREIKLIKEAIDRDKKSINNWETQIKAIEYERK